MTATMMSKIAIVLVLTFLVLSAVLLFRRRSPIYVGPVYKHSEPSWSSSTKRKSYTGYSKDHVVPVQIDRPSDSWIES